MRTSKGSTWDHHAAPSSGWGRRGTHWGLRGSHWSLRGSSWS
jgi:hypothetical protein